MNRILGFRGIRIQVPLGTIHTNDGFLTRRQEEQIKKVPAGRQI